MQSLNSKNYESVSVTLRNEDKPIVMNSVNGTALMNHLVTENSTHVGVTDREGRRVVIRTTDILRVEPAEKISDIKDYT